MKMIIGLGNPGKKYADTKHNVGFLAIDKIAKNIGVNSFTETISKFNALIVKARFNGEKILLVKPQTYMNLSGEAVKPLLNWYKINIDDIIIIYDDLDLPIGKIRYREKGSSGGHNGIKSIIYHLDTEEFKRVKIGINRPKDLSIVDYVLTKFSLEEKEIVNKNLDFVTEAIMEWLKGEDFKKIMSIYSTKT